MQVVPAPLASIALGPWVQFVVATPDGTFRWPPEEYGWGAAKVTVDGGSSKEDQKAAGRKKAKTKKSGPSQLKVKIEITWVRTAWEEPTKGVCALLNAIDPNNPSGQGGPFDFIAADFNRRGGKAIDVDKVGSVEWRGHIGTCTIEATEWTPEPPKQAGAAGAGQGTTTPEKVLEEFIPGEEAQELPASGVLIARKGIAQRAREIALRGFDGTNQPTSKP